MTRQSKALKTPQATNKEVSKGTMENMTMVASLQEEKAKMSAESQHEARTYRSITKGMVETP